MSRGLREVLQIQSARQIRCVKFAPSHCERVSRELAERFDCLDSKLPVGVNLAEIKIKLSEAFRQRDDESLSKKEWRYSPLCLDTFIGQADSNDFMRWYLESLSERLNCQMARRLALAYAQTFVSKSPATQMLGEFLDSHAQLLGETWNSLIKRFQIFTPAYTLQLLTKTLLDSRFDCHNGYVKKLEMLGLRNAVAVSRLGVEVFVKTMEQAQVILTATPTQKTFQHVMALASDGANGFAMQGAEVSRTVANTLLLPYQDRTPEPEIKSEIERYLLQRLGDPRLNKFRWNPVDESANAVMRRWLNKVSLEQFLRIVDKVVNTDENAKRMWSIRRDFWTSYLTNGHLRDAWCAFGSLCSIEAHSLARQAGVKTKNYAEIIGNIEQNHAVLIMHIGSLTIADWSHNSKGHIWNTHLPPSPKLYELQYHKSKLKENSDYSYRHDQYGNWRNDVADYIYKYTGIKFR